ncbi:transcription factor LHW [Juglans microcarpa x Juglans regia]|uniref:transcription factor LHW n=1 Tax=Juglans microcarpa x Juglans regia TaxID=2249226 RepID=UPI001B7E381B|nr:transcription factor LHW [Juglans microcarpa x Juglans regia]
MGFLLKEALKTLCGSSQWSYAVFWKIGCQNPKLLIWEDCYYEPSASSALHIAGSETFRECERSWDSPEIRSSQLRIQAGDRVHSLINVMMINNQVNVVGEGIVGRAAFTGNHQWILSNNYTGAVHPPEVLNEVLHQFTAGIQTVAVIPILPHGVVQLGSSLSIMENIGFVNDVRSLILQLGCVPSALFSNNYETKDTAENIGVPFLGVPVSVEPSEVTNSLPLTVDICNQRSNSSHDSLLVCQSSHPLIRETQNKKFQPPDQAQMLPQCHDEHCQPKATSIVKPNFSFNSQLENGVVGAEVIPSNPVAWLNQQACFYSSRSGYNNQPGFSQLGGSKTTQNSMEQQIFSGSAVQDHLNKNSSVSSTFKMSRLRTSGGLMLDPHIGSVTSLCGGSKLHGGISNHLRPNSVCCTLPTPRRAADTNLSGIHLTNTEVQYVHSSKTRGVSLSSRADQVPAGHMLSGEDQRHISTVMKHNENELAPREQKMDTDSFQVLDMYAHPEKHMSMSEHIPGLFAHCQNRDNGSRTPSTIGKHEYTSAQPLSGDDLFDILGVEFKNKLLNDTRNNFLADGPDANLQNLCENSSVLMGMLDVGADLFSECEGISESGIFSGMGSDHLLDAVVSRAHSASKQRLDDDVSCRTALTNISSSSVPSSSGTYGRVGMSDHVQGELFGLPKPQGKKVGTVEASSLRSGCSKDDAGNLSQATSIYGSHISSWVEQGNNVKCDNSVSTAYSKKPDEINKSNRKRLKPGENPRPRPKDRQMIQDRVKELREIVPNGAKCSIDSLLERTIKHMLFLQSVTKHADKLKQTGDSKIVSKDGGLLLKDNFEGGATWAYEVGSQSMVCPIIVEDLNPPRQMLVEMLCEERGFFLEIAEIIRGLGLTILKGVMEARNDKVWARFAVEANRDITRVEIFMSLVRLLEQTVKP